MPGTTAPVAQAARIYVAQQYFLSLASDPTYGVAYRTTVWMNTYPLNAFSGPRVAIYRNGGTNQDKGLGTIKQYRDPRFRIDLFGRNFAEAEQMCEAINNAFEIDYDFFNPPSTPTAGQGYLRTQGGIKYLDMTEWQATNEERATGAYYRRIADAVVTIMDA
jgi:hypothetical protein